MNTQKIFRRAVYRSQVESSDSFASGSEMLDDRVYATVEIAFDFSCSEGSVQEGIFPESFLHPSPTRIPANIQNRTKGLVDTL
jgi:hypothetical protein